jgi:hypothetical protein
MRDGEAEPGPPIDFDPEKDQKNRIKHGIYAVDAYEPSVSAP